jgi:hypothetical protein
MSQCALCRHPTPGPEGLCGYHAAAQGDDWAAGNRIVCDFLHRGIVPAAPPTRAGSILELLGQPEAQGRQSGAPSTPGFCPAAASIEAPAIDETVLAGASQSTSDRPLRTRGERSCDT